MQQSWFKVQSGRAGEDPQGRERASPEVTVTVTLGPRGRNVVLDEVLRRAERHQRTAVTVAKEIELEDKFEKHGRADG